MGGSNSLEGSARSAFGAIDGAMSCRATAARFGIAPSTAISWQAQRRGSESFAPRPQDGGIRLRRVEKRRADILTIWEALKDISLEELRLALIEVGLQELVARLHRFFIRHCMTRK